MGVFVYVKENNMILPVNIRLGELGYLFRCNYDLYVCIYIYVVKFVGKDEGFIYGG